jgi:hypothetical protein
MNPLKLRQRFLSLIVLAWIFSCSATAFSQDIDVRISTREAWVGSPIVLQLQIRNAKNYSLPEDFEIDGCDVRSAGTPSQSSQITIINGRRSESRSVTMQYQITPRRAGEFQIPELAVEVDGETKRTRPISFVATKSETGDLLFVEVEGDKESVFVGQPLDIKLKIWVKPYVDRKNNIKLDEGQMWQLLSNQTSWGSFEDRMQELTENRQRPGGESILRKDEKGRSREYYLYEINGTIYPTKPGKIDASDLQVVVNYPLSIGRRRDPMDSFFGDSPFGGSSLMKEMMGDDFFSSPFGRRLTVTESRPVVAEANVNSTEVLPVPVAGQPADYRGAVGRYKIIAEADPKNVAAGDPVTLRLGIIGDGPMELVQAPPLHEIDSLVDDFQVTDQSLAGFVQDDTKVFMTTIRPRSEEVVQIPPIPFSFFDPDKKEYQTVYSDPIKLNVEKAESLGLDAIVSNAPSGSTAESERDDSASSSPSATGDWRAKLTGVVQGLKQWWYVALVPPACLLAFYLTKFAFAAPALVARLRSPLAIAKQGIQQAETESDLAVVLREYVAGVTRKECPSFERAVGRIRETRDDQLARKMESLYQRIERSNQSVSQWMAAEESHTLDDLKSECSELLLPIEQAWKNRRRRA